MATGKSITLPNDACPHFVVTTWFHDGFGHYRFEDDITSDPDDFIEDNCRDCSYYFDSYIDYNVAEIEDGEGNPASYVEYESRCPCKSEGIASVAWPCAAGYDEPSGFREEDLSGTLPPMAFSIELDSAGFANLFRAWLQRCDPAHFTTGMRYRSINCYDAHDICWGNYNSKPNTLEEAVTTYCDAQCNADLLSPSEFLSNIRIIRNNESCGNRVNGVAIAGEHPMALLASQQLHTSAYLLLRGSGQAAADGLVFGGLWAYRHDGLDGFITHPDATGHCWFVIPHPDRLEDTCLENTGLLLGQIPTPPHLLDLSCSSPAPSSSEPAALAAC